MIGKFSGRIMMVTLLAAAATGFAGCSGSGDDDDSSTPAPAPMDDFFRVTEMAVGDSDTGVDIDGDGTVDNNIETTLEAISTTILEQVEAALVAAGVESCTEPNQQGCLESIMDKVTTAVDSVLSIESLSDALNRPVSEGQITYLLEFKEESAAINLNWWTGEFRNTAYATVSSLGIQPGSLDTAGSGTFGPGDLTLRFYFEPTNPNGEEQDPIEIPITLYDAQTVVSNYNETKLTDFTYGGAISTEDLLGLVEELLNSINEILPEAYQINVEDILAQVAETIAPYADINIDSDSDLEGFSLGLVGSADQVSVLDSE